MGRNKSIKTTLAGILGGFILLAGPPIGARLSGDTTMPPITSERVIIAATLAALGYLAKDHDKTGLPR